MLVRCGRNSVYCSTISAYIVEKRQREPISAKLNHQQTAAAEQRVFPKQNDICELDIAWQYVKIYLERFPLNQSDKNR